MKSRNQTPILRKELTAPRTLIHHFLKIRNTLSGQAEGITLDYVLTSQLISLLICKIYDERNTPPEKPTVMQWLPGETLASLNERIQSVFHDVKSQKEIAVLFDDKESIGLTPDLLAQVVRIIQPFELTHAERDVIGEAFESFLGPTLRGEEGQFFTPRNVVKLACEIINPRSGELVVDPACGTGGFLTEVIRKKPANQKNVRVCGIEKDKFLAQVASTQIRLLQKDTDSRVFCANSLSPFHAWPSSLVERVQPGAVDVVITNPPFGSKISVGYEVVRHYHLGKVWRRSRNSTDWAETQSFAKDRPPQILFIERCLELLKPGGRLGIVVPDGILGNVNLGYVREYIRANAEIVAIVDCPLETFLPSTSTKTSLVFLRKKHLGSKQDMIFMAVAEKCGHNRRGKPLVNQDGAPDDDFPIIAKEFRRWSAEYAPDF